jgi:hypothetical protein
MVDKLIKLTRMGKYRYNNNNNKGLMFRGACTLVLQLKVYPMHVTNYMEANELKSPLVSSNLHSAYSISCKIKYTHFHIFFESHAKNQPVLLKI